MWIIDNLAIKIGALLIALFLWFHAITEKEYEVRQVVPIEISAVPEELVQARSIPSNAVIRLKGKGKQLIVPYFSHIRLLIEATWAKKGTIQIILSPEHVDVAHGRGALEMEIISPQKLDLEFDDLLRKKVPVRSRIAIEPTEGFIQVGPIGFKPDSVLVSGPAQYVQSVNFVTTDSVHYDEAKKAIADVVNLLNPEGFNVTYVPQQIDAAIEIQRLAQRTINEIPVTLTHIPEGVRAYLEPSEISITISGGESYLSSLTAESFSVSADYRRAHRRTDNLINARINLPAEVELTGAEPQMFKVVIGS
jgi:YbbR domain-containing protein